MTQLTNQLTEQYYAVEVPEGACGLEVYNNNLYGLTHPAMSVRREFAYLQPGNWQFLFTTYEMNYDDAIYIYKNTGMKLPELLRSKGLDDKKNYAILKKQLW